MLLSTTHFPTLELWQTSSSLTMVCFFWAKSSIFTFMFPLRCCRGSFSTSFLTFGGGKGGLSAGNFWPRTTPANIAKQMDLRKHPRIPQKSKSFLLKHQQVPLSEVLLWSNAEAFLEETAAGNWVACILSPFLPPSSSVSAAPGI